MKKIIALCIVISLLAVTSVGIWWYTEKTAPINYRAARLNIGDDTLLVDIADNARTLARGLSGRETLAEDSGMLFIFNESRQHGFWMKEMHFAIDIIWLDDQWSVVDVTKNVSPNTYPTIFAPSVPARYVVEVNAGWTDAHQISKGERVVLNEN